MASQTAFEPMEHYMLAEHRASHPMTFIVRFRLQSLLSEEQFRKAYLAVLQEHPLLMSRVLGDPHGRRRDLRWIQDEAQLDSSLIFCDSKQQREPTRSEMQMDLARGHGLRMWVRQTGFTSDVLMLVHHACCDGLGAIRFLNDVMSRYTRLTETGDVPGDVSGSPSVLLNRRDRFRRKTRQFPASLARSIWRVCRALRFRAEPIASAPSISNEFDTNSAPFQPLLSYTFSNRETREFLDAARQRNVSVNDLLVRDLFLTIDDWNTNLDGRRRIRIAVPQNLRQSHHEGMSAANVVGMVFLDRKPPELNCPDALLRGIAAETAIIKRHRSGMSLLRVASLLGSWNGGIKRITAQDRDETCRATAVFSNLGSPFGMDRSRALYDWQSSVPLKQIELYPPVRPNTHVAFAACTLKGRLTLTLNYHPGAFSKEAAQLLFEVWLTRVRSSAAPAKRFERRAPAGDCKNNSKSPTPELHQLV